jgi:hypothetical protein
VSDKDILGKADALLNRHTAARLGGDTVPVPVLTDLVEGPVSPAAPTDPLAREVFVRVMAQVEGRLTAELERRVSQHLVPQIHAAIASAVGDLHQEIANAIGDAVAEALKARNVK